MEQVFDVNFIVIVLCGFTSLLIEPLLPVGVLKPVEDVILAFSTVTCVPCEFPNARNTPVELHVNPPCCTVKPPKPLAVLPALLLGLKMPRLYRSGPRPL
jgi:hypothetical protein